MELSMIKRSDRALLVRRVFERSTKPSVIAEIAKWRSRGCKVIIVTAGPEKYLEPVAKALKVQIVGSQIWLGINFLDLQGRKKRLYEALVEDGYQIAAIYSDLVEDLWCGATENYLVQHDTIKRWINALDSHTT